MSVPPGTKAINWEHRASDGTAVCSKCGMTIAAGCEIAVRLDGYAEDPTTFCVPCVTPVSKPQPPVLTINAQGELIGDVSHLSAETLEQLRAPEGREQLKTIYRKQFSTGRRVIAQATHREPIAEQRDFRHLCPPGMSSKEFRKVRRKYMREQTKSVVREMRAR